MRAEICNKAIEKTYFDFSYRYIVVSSFGSFERGQAFVIVWIQCDIMESSHGDVLSDSVYSATDLVSIDSKAKALEIEAVRAADC